MWCHVTFYLFPRALSGMIIISSGIVFMETKALHLPEAFVYFLNENGLDPSIYTATGASLYKIYGIDAASGAVVTALDISLGDHDLDLCAAPGAKLCMISDFLGNSGSVTGVDVARHRLAACRTMLQKYALGDRCRLFVVDGTTFSRVHSNSRTWILPWKKSWILTRNGHLGDLEKKGKAQENSNLQLVPQIQDPELIFYGLHSGVVGLSKNELYQITNGIEDSHCGYDKNAHMISIKHIQKFENWGWTTLQWRVLNAERTDDLTVLRLLLLTNGFKLLKVGGSLVYSTCSLTVAQNEDVIEQFLLPNTSAELLEIDAAKKWPCKSGRIQKTLRFDPLTSQTSGFFVAKFTKLIF